MNRAERAEQAAFLEALAKEARAAAAVLRSGLDEAARRELTEQGVAPSWRIPGLGVVPLSTTSDAVAVVDKAAFLAWVEKNHPDNVEVIRQVRPAFQDGLFSGALRRLRDDPVESGSPLGDRLYEADGTVIDGVAFVAGGKPVGISVRPDGAAKRRLTARAQEVLADLIAADRPVTVEAAA